MTGGAKKGFRDFDEAPKKPASRRNEPFTRKDPVEKRSRLILRHNFFVSFSGTEAWLESFPTDSAVIASPRL
jgi:hypothetical protein